MTSDPQYPVKDLEWVYHACSADESLPPGDPRWHDFSALRGGNVLTELGVILKSQTLPGKYHHRILCGHRGCGKSTELRSLKKWADENGFLTIWIEVDLYFGLAALQFSDLYLLAAESVARAMDEFGSPLPADKLERVVQWFAKVTQEDAEDIRSELKIEAGAKTSSAFSQVLGGLFAHFSAGVKAGSEHHSRVRMDMRQAPNVLIDLTNDLLVRAQQQLRERGRPHGLLLLFDNLDRFEPEAIKTLLLEGSTLIRELACHAVFTMPINLHYGPDSPYQDSYGGPATILPMLALRSPDAAWAESVNGSPFVKKAVDEMVKALNRRIEVRTLFAKPSDARLLVKMSGGCIRELLHLVNLAYQKSFTSLDAPVQRLTARGVRRAIEEYRGYQTAGLLVDDYQRLAAVARRDPGSQTLDDSMLQLLRRRIAFRYSNGKEQWLDVHPLVIETEGFQRAFASPPPDTTTT